MSARRAVVFAADSTAPNYVESLEPMRWVHHLSLTEDAHG